MPAKGWALGKTAMKRLPWVLLWIALLPTAGTCGEIYGNIREEKKPVPPGVRVEVRCGRDEYKTVTDRYGSYRFYVPEKGRCTIKVIYRRSSPSLGIFSYEGSVRYDLVLEEKDGGYSLRRQ